jgi:hypothetical protein
MQRKPDERTPDDPPLALPVFATVALAHRYIQIYAPTNCLVRRVRVATPRLRTAVGLLGIAAALVFAMHVVAEAVAAGAPGELNLVVLVLAWDAIKLALTALSVVGHRAARLAARVTWGPNALANHRARFRYRRPGRLENYEGHVPCGNAGRVPFYFARSRPG